MLNSNFKNDSTSWKGLHSLQQRRSYYCCVNLCMCSKQFALLQPLLHARVKHRLIWVPVHVFDPGKRTDD